MNRREIRRRITPEVAGTLQMLAELLLLFWIFSGIVSGFEIHQTSMEPTFHEGQRVIVNKLGGLMERWVVGVAHAANDSQHVPFAPHRGQVVVFRSLTTADETLIKRTIGIPGDQIELRNGMVFVNGERIAEPYIHGQTTACHSYCRSITLGPEEYFMMGDNRSVSMDSRSFGPVPADNIVGSVVLRYWPPSAIEVYDQ